MAIFFKKLKKYISNCLLITVMANQTSFRTNVDDIISKMSFEEKLGQIMCLDVRFWNGDPVAELNLDIKNILSRYSIGNIILFSQNFKDKFQSQKLISDLKENSKNITDNIPMLICVDQEGGLVERFQFGRESRLENNSDIGKHEISVAQIKAFEKGKMIGQELANLGINCNLAPVVDINSNPMNPVINVRSFGNTADVVSRCGIEFIKGLHSENILATAKHFPGHGDTNTDSHIGLPVVNKTLEKLEELELIPFKNMINNGVDIIMTAHIQLPNIDSSTILTKSGEKIICPATLSSKILTEILRKKMGFHGVIMTDAMNMRAISNYVEEHEAVRLAIMAGANIICMPTILRTLEDVAKLEKIFDYIKKSAESDKFLELKINESVKYILELKQKLNY